MPFIVSPLDLLATFIIVFLLGVATRWVAFSRRPTNQPRSCL